MVLGTRFRDRFLKKRKELSAFVPKQIVDFHVHMGLPEHAEQASAERKKTRMAVGFPQHSSARALDLMYKKLLNIENSKTKKVIFPFHRYLFDNF